MESNSLCESLLKWLETFPGREGTKISQLTDGVLMANVLHQIAPEYFSEYWLTRIKNDVGDNWRLKVSNLRKVQQGVVDYYQEQLNQNIRHFPLPDLNKIGEHGDAVEMGRMLQLLLGCAVNCENKQQYIEAIMNMEERVQKVIMEAIQELMLREGSPGPVGLEGDGREGLGLVGGGPASFHPHLKTILEQLEAATLGKEEAIRTCHELEQQISVLKEDKNTLSSENERLVGRLEAWEAGADLGAGSSSTLRYKDLRKQIEGLQDELFKAETSRDEYRSRAEVLELKNQEVQTKNEELQQLADQARTLKDEVDVLREMSERAVVYEGTMETYKKKLEELSDLKRQVRILEEKNSDYMQQNMELEEEVKKSGTWRPQLDMYKKQVGELHQRVAEEAKKTDRQIFENKKLAEKMEALVQERDRLAKERDGLKETIEELKCHISTITSPDTASRPPSDLSDVDLLDAVPHEFRERLMRLQYENSVLKKAAEGGSSEQLPMLQTLVADLQERQASLTQENRWGSGGNLGETGGLFSPHSKLGGSLSPPLLPGSYTLPDFHFSSDRKLRVIRKNLKWASESDLLVLRQPRGLLFPSSSSPPILSFSPQPTSLPPLPATSSATLATQTAKEAPIVIRHIHEFKMPPSPTNEDSGCCRTSPSSCEEETHQRDFAGTLDSGISGMFPGTLESGVSGVYGCLSPVIPPIVEECTAHHLSDLLPCTLHNSTILHHSHPAHTSTCLHCCSSHPSPRPHSVCSYNPPQYKHTSPHTSPQALPQPNSSPPLSPLTHPLIASVTPTTPNTSTSTHTQSSSLPKLDSMEERSPSPPAATAPLPVSPTGRRSAGGSYTRTPIPPASPTPHNSPRLPSSINATRCRTKVSPTLGLQEALQDMPSSPSTTAKPQGTQERAPRPQHTPVMPPETQKEEKTVNISADKVTDRTPSTPTSRAAVLERGGVRSSVNRRRSESQDSRRGSGSSSPPHISRKAAGESITPPVASRSPSQLPEHARKSRDAETFISCLPPPSVQAIRRSEGRIERNSPAYSSMQPVRREGGTALERNSPLRASVQPVRDRGRKEISNVPASLQPLRDAGKVRDTSTVMPPMHASNVAPSVQPIRDAGKVKETSSVAASSVQPVRTERSLLLSSAIPTIASQPARDLRATNTATHSGLDTTNLPYTHSNIQNTALPTPHTTHTPTTALHGTQQPRGTTNTPTTPSHSTQHPRNTPLVTPQPAPVRQPTDKASPRTGRGKPSQKQANHVKFREPVVSQVSHSDPTAQYSPASPRERVSPHRPQEAPRKASDVTLLSDTLFTRFEVAKLPHRMQGRGNTLSATDTDTDLETLERRLTLGMYAAPLVSSESCTSFSHDDYTDAASDDLDYYNPMQYKAYGDGRRRRRASSCPRQSLARPMSPPRPNVPQESPLGRTYSFFRRQKSKKQHKVADKTLVPPLGQAGHVVKPRNKTAKVVVAETLNAVFTLCTP